MERVAELQDKLVALQDSVTQLQGHIERLANFDFQPGSIPLGASDEDNVSAELSSEINQILREHEEDLELLQEEIVDIRPLKSLKHDKDRLKDGADRLKGELHSCRISFRKAQVLAKKNLQLAQKQEKELLWASFAQPRSVRSSGTSSPKLVEKPRRKARSEMSKDEQMVASSGDVTQALRRTHDMMAAELSRSDFAHKTLKESTAALSQLSESYSSLDTLLSSSRDLLGTLMKSQKSDTWYLETAFYLLVGTIGWLIYRRFLSGPLWLVLLLPKLIFRGGVSVSNMVGHQGGNDGVTVESAGSQPVAAEMNNEGVPTIHVEQPHESMEATKDLNEDSMVEELGRMIDESKHGAMTDDTPRSTEDIEHIEFAADEEAERARDEL